MKKQAAPPSVAIVGIAGLFPSLAGGDSGLDGFWETVRDAGSVAREAPAGRWLLDPEEAYDPQVGTPDHLYSKRACFLESVPTTEELPDLGLDADFLNALDPIFHLTLGIGRRAFQDAKMENVNRSRVGVILGNIALPTDTTTAFARETLGRGFEECVLDTLRESGRIGATKVVSSSGIPTHPLNLSMPGLPAGLLARALGLGLGAYTLDSACASSLFALKLAADELLSGRADAMLTGGVSRPDCFFTQMGFSQLRAVSPTGRCSPFDFKGDGLVVGEGGGMFVLKRTADAVRDGDHIYGILRGFGLSNDVGGSLLAPLSEGQLRAMRPAYEQAGWNPSAVDLVECHATGTPVGDAVEFSSLVSMWASDGDSAPARSGKCVIGSVKSNIGHLLTGAGAAALMKVLLALRHKTLLPTANFERAGDNVALEESPFRVLPEAEPWPEPEKGEPRRAAVSAFGFGGTNAHVLVEEWCEKAGPRPSRRAHPVSKSGKRPSTSLEPIAIVGMDATFGPWKGLRAFQERVLGGNEGDQTTTNPHWWGAQESAWLKTAAGTDSPIRGYHIDSIDVPLDGFRIPPKELKEMLPQQTLMLQVAAAAASDARMDAVDDLRTGIFVGIGLDSNTANFALRWDLLNRARAWNRELDLGLTDSDLDDWVAELREAMGPALTANRTMGALGGVIASRIARELRIGGPCVNVSSDETSGLRALEVALRSLRNGSLDAALVGAVGLSCDVRAALAQDAATPFSPKGAPAPFDAAADGPVPGEGAVALVLKRYDDAIRDGDRVYAVVCGLGFAAPTQSTDTSFDADAYTNALWRAYTEAKVDPGAVRYIEANASGHAEHDAAEARALMEFFDGALEPGTCPLGSVKADIGHTGPAAGLASLAKAALCLYQEIIPPSRNVDIPRPELSGESSPFSFPRRQSYWLRNRAGGPRRAGVSAVGRGGDCVHVLLEGAEQVHRPTVQTDRLQPTGGRNEALFAIEADNTPALAVGLSRLRSHAMHYATFGIERLARLWWHENRTDSSRHLGLALVARSRRNLMELIDLAQQALARSPEQRIGGPNAEKTRDRVFFSPQPFGPRGEIGFVYPGSGNHFADMGRELGFQWPEVLRLQDTQTDHLRDQYHPSRFWDVDSIAEIDEDHRTMIFGQVALGAAVSDLIQNFGVRPNAVIGYSLGESAGLFSLRAWTDRDLMMRRMNESTLFTEDLAGQCEAARRAWKLPASKSVDWVLGVIDRPAKVVRASLQDHKKVYRLIVNTLHECVIGGDRKAVERLVKKLECEFFPLQGVTTVHCEVAKEVEGPYRELHLFDTTPPRDVRFYSGAWGTSYHVNRDSAADSILAQALYGIDYPKVINAAYDDGVRIFLEMGPGASCTRMIGQILEERPHVVRSACMAGNDPVSMVLRMLGQLIAERVPVDLSVLYGQETKVVAHSDPDSLRSQHRISIPLGGEPYEAPLPLISAEEQVEPSPPVKTAPREPVVAPSISSKVEPPVAVPPRPVPQDVKPGVARDLIQQIETTETAKLRAHENFLRFNDAVTRTMSETIAFQMALIGAAQGGGVALTKGLMATMPEIPATLAADYAPAPAFDRAMCMEFAIGSISKMLGPKFSAVDTYPTRVRLPDEPLMLVDRIVSVEGEPAALADPSLPCSSVAGRVVTEHDVRPGAWYLDSGRIAPCVSIEAGQADLFLSGYLGVDFRTKGLARYRLLDAVVTYHDVLPRPGDVIRYDIRILQFFRQGQTHLFRFEYDGTVGGRPLITMRNGCAGFFTNEELDGGKGIILTEKDREALPGKCPRDWKPLVPMVVESYDEGQLDALRRGDLAVCFGPRFKTLGLRRPCVIPGADEPEAGQRPKIDSGSLKLIHRVTHLDPEGGRYGLGIIRSESDIHPDDWFLVSHFSDDPVMPGTLMYEYCLHTLRVFLMRMGWVGEADGVVCQPVPGVKTVLVCRGQVLKTTRKATFEVVIKEIGYGAPSGAEGENDGQTPYALADVLMYADEKMMVDIRDMSVRLSGLTREVIEALWETKGTGFARDPLQPLYGFSQLLAFSNGNPSEAYGERYRVFDSERPIARLPRPPYQFIDRVMDVSGDPWKMRGGTVARLEYDVPPTAWYFKADGESRTMPFAVLLEIALQPCGWVAAYMGSALTNDKHLRFRNLGGAAVQVTTVTKDIGSLTILARCDQVSNLRDMIIQNYSFEIHRRDAFPLNSNLGEWFETPFDPEHPLAGCLSPATLVYRGETQFGFFSEEALADQTGIRDAALYAPGADAGAAGLSFAYPAAPPFPTNERSEGLANIHITARELAALPSDQSADLRVLDTIDLFLPDGGPHGLGFVRGSKKIDASDWYFQAHFKGDPVMPGSLGVEVFLQALKVPAAHRWLGGIGPEGFLAPEAARGSFECLASGEKHTWLYRGQVLPSCRRMVAEVHVKFVDETRRVMRADGFLIADGLTIFQMNDFALRVHP